MILVVLLTGLIALHTLFILKFNDLRRFCIVVKQASAYACYMFHSYFITNCKH